MTLNESVLDRVIRLVAAIVLYFVAFNIEGSWRVAALVLGTLMLVTSATGFCVVYRLFGISTRR